VDVVKLLVEAGANPMIAKEYGCHAPMVMAQLCGHHQCIELLQVSRCSTVEWQHLVVVMHNNSFILSYLAVVTH